MSSNFDPNAFLDSTTTEALTKRPPLPAGSDFVGTILEISMRPWQGKKDPTQSGWAMDVQIEIDLTAYPEVQKALGGIPKITMKDGIMLEMSASGGIDNSPGKNSKLRRYREAVGLNEAGAPFSPRMMQGRQIRVKIKHRPYEGDIFDEVDSVAKA